MQKKRTTRGCSLPAITMQGKRGTYTVTLRFLLQAATLNKEEEEEISYCSSRITASPSFPDLGRAGGERMLKTTEKENEAGCFCKHYSFVRQPRCWKETWRNSACVNRQIELSSIDHHDSDSLRRWLCIFTVSYAAQIEKDALPRINPHCEI